MLPEIISLLPEQVARCPAGTASLFAGLGAVLWAVGARFSRSILTLSAVAVGTMLGMRMPAWRGWAIDGMGLAVGGAVALGTCAYLFHRTCIGVLLGGAMMLWAGAAVWMAMAGDVYWNWHAVQWNGDLVQLLRDTWQTLPPNLARAVPMACLFGLAAGVTLAIVCSKLSKVLTHSLLGATLAAVMGAVVMASARPGALLRVPGSNAAQGAALAAIVLVGAAWQWRITPPHRSAGGGGGRGQGGAKDV